MFKSYNESELNTLYRYALALCQNENHAYDLVQETMLKLHSKIYFKKIAYAKKTLRNLFFDEMKHLKTQEKYLETMIENDVVNDIDLYIKKDELEKILTDLLPQERELLYLIYVEEKSYKEVSKLHEVKISTLLSRVRRLKKNIQQGLTNER